jgi:hypothetical protein
MPDILARHPYLLDGKGTLIMRFLVFCGALIVAAVLVHPASGGAQAGKSGDASKAAASGAPSAQSGIYGFSGTGAKGTSDPNTRSGVMGECIWVFDAPGKNQITTGNCASPGNFRVALAPGHYVVKGPGVSQSIEVKPGAWTKVDSIGEAYY